MAADGQIIAEFSSLNALNPKAPASSPHGRQPHSAREARRGRFKSIAEDGLNHNERLLAGDVLYTGGSGSGAGNEHFVDDLPAPQPLGVSHLLPELATTEERERLLRRLEMCAKAREESTKIMSLRFAQRDAVKHDMKRERQQHLEKLVHSSRERDERWNRRLQRSPFAVDLVAENQRIDEENRVRDHVERRRQRLMQRKAKEAHNAIFERAKQETDELEQLRAEKRMLLENEKQLKALRDVERSNARTAQILQERRRAQLEREHAQLQQVALGNRERPPPLSAR